ncbi:MAG: two pore domain potassium channel family protein [Deltaproteobacteria bacterium]|nr:two pore domain potassium channel family protein [Deltaproteobacteria bacterium]
MDTLAFRLRVFILLLFIIIIVGTFGFMFIESLSPADAFYFSIVTITTVGYGDIHPATQLGKILAVVLIITGVGTFLGVVANATEMLLNRREKKIREQKLNMVVGMFFSELGTKILSYFTGYDPQVDVIRKKLIVKSDWSEEDFLDVKALLDKYQYEVDPQKLRLQDLKSLLEQNGYFLLTLWENPNLLEQEAFTETLRAILHMKEELLPRWSTLAIRWRWLTRRFALIWYTPTTAFALPQPMVRATVGAASSTVRVRPPPWRAGRAPAYRPRHCVLRHL